MNCANAIDEFPDFDALLNATHLPIKPLSAAKEIWKKLSGIFS